jgi:hypothetical protein
MHLVEVWFEIIEPEAPWRNPIPRRRAERRADSLVRTETETADQIPPMPTRKPVDRRTY